MVMIKECKPTTLFFIRHETPPDAEGEGVHFLGFGI